MLYLQAGTAGIFRDALALGSLHAFGDVADASCKDEPAKGATTRGLGQEDEDLPGFTDWSLALN